MKIDRLSAGTACAALVFFLTGCSDGVDLSTVRLEQAKPIQRSDVVQAVVARGSYLAAGTQSGAILLSDDAGKHWTRNTLGKPFTASIIDMAACPDGGFLALDFYGRVWSSDASAKNWTEHKLENPQIGLTITCDKAGAWWVAGTYANIAKSVDQGKTWQVVDLKKDAQITALRWIDEKQGVAVGEFGLLLKTEDGGATWWEMPPITTDFYAYDVLFTDEKTGWVSGVAGQLYQTQDGGKTWQLKENETASPLYRLFLHQRSPYAVGARGVIARLDGDVWRAVDYADAIPVFIGGGTSVEGAENAIIIGGPGGLLRPVSVSARQ